MQTTLCDLSKFCKLGGGQFLSVNIRIGKYLLDLQNFVRIMQASLTTQHVAYLYTTCTVEVGSK